jgi:hypothetical protein
MRFSLLRTAAVLVTVAQVVDAAFAELGKTVSVDGIFYYAAPNPISTILLTAQQLVLAPKCTGDDSLIPFTVMEDKSPLFNATVFDSIVKNYTAVDDVFNKEFLQSKSAPPTNDTMQVFFILVLKGYSDLSQAYRQLPSQGAVPT